MYIITWAKQILRQKNNVKNVIRHYIEEEDSSFTTKELFFSSRSIRGSVWAYRLSDEHLLSPEFFQELQGAKIPESDHPLVRRGQRSWKICVPILSKSLLIRFREHSKS